MLAAAAIALGGCAAAAPPSSPVVVPLAADDSAAARIAGRARAADVVYLGEQHDNPAHHDRQRQILAALVAGGARPAVAFEMLDEGQQAAVDRALAEGLSGAALEDRLGWRARGWPDFRMYEPLFEIAARERLPVVALDLDRAAARRIARDGPAAPGPGGAPLASLLPADPDREAAIARSIRDGHCGLLAEARLPGMVAAWHARNVAMARRIDAALAAARPVVVIVGRGHQDAGGLPAQLDRLRPGARQLVVSFVEAHPGERPDTAVSADVVWLTPPVERGDPCAALRSAP